MLTCNLVLAMCLLQVSPPTSMPGDQASLHPVTARGNSYFFAANRISVAEASEIAAAAWLPNPQQAPVTTTSPNLALEHSAARGNATDFLPAFRDRSLLDQRSGQQHFPAARKFPFSLSRNRIVSPRRFKYKASEVGTLFLAYQLNKN